MTKASDVSDEKNQEILKQLAAGEEAKNLSKIVFLSPPAISWRLRKMQMEMGCKNTIHLISTVIRMGII